jgi:hypothetical protein
MAICLRCNTELEPAEPQTPDTSYYSCPACQCEYAQKPGEGLHDRWLMPLSLPLYAVIFDKNPSSRAGEIAQHFVAREDLDLDVLEQHIDDELSNPKQKVSEILNFVSATEDQLRDFLAVFRDELRSLRGCE